MDRIACRLGLGPDASTSTEMNAGGRSLICDRC
jgi:hypothetical protein